MALEGGAVAESLDALLGLERSRLVRLCAHLTGDAEVAEDLAQETLLEAWRNGHKLHQREGYVQWLSAIARNVCRRWARTRAGDLEHQLQLCRKEEGPLSAPDEDLAAGCDIEVELERDELATLLD